MSTVTDTLDTWLARGENAVPELTPDKFADYLRICFNQSRVGVMTHGDTWTPFILVVTMTPAGAIRTYQWVLVDIIPGSEACTFYALGSLFRRRNDTVVAAYLSSRSFIEETSEWCLFVSGHVDEETHDHLLAKIEQTDKGPFVHEPYDLSDPEQCGLLLHFFAGYRAEEMVN